jgi:hypothetical protein
LETPTAADRRGRSRGRGETATPTARASLRLALSASLSRRQREDDDPNARRGDGLPSLRAGADSPESTPRGSLFLSFVLSFVRSFVLSFFFVLLTFLSAFFCVRSFFRSFFLRGATRPKSASRLRSVDSSFVVPAFFFVVVLVVRGYREGPDRLVRSAPRAR